MVRESPYQKALSMAGIMAVFGFVIAMTGLSQLATVSRPNWIIVFVGLVTMAFGLLSLCLASSDQE